MVYSLKIAFLISTTVVPAVTCIFLFTPYAQINEQACIDTFNLIAGVFNYLTESTDTIIPHAISDRVSDALVVIMEDIQLYFEVPSTAVAYWVDALAASVTACMMSLVIIIPVATLIRLGWTTSFITQMRGFLVSAIVPNLPFKVGQEVIVVFIYFFMSLYFLEVHFFFIFSLGLSSDSIIYQFNFLATSFALIFFIKFYKNLIDSSIFFSVTTLFNSNLNFKKKWHVAKLETCATPGTRSLISYISIARTVVFATLYVFFFFTTFIVWLLRYVIQFIRLLVLYMIHTVFEFAIISNDSYFSTINQVSFFFFKSFFLIFFFFWGFLYLLVYLNLMFTLQAFIFFFFSEVFQSNFLFDLSAVVAAKTALIKKY